MLRRGAAANERHTQALTLHRLCLPCHQSVRPGTTWITEHANKQLFVAAGNTVLALLWSSATGNQSWISQTQHGLETDTRQIDIRTQSHIRRHTSSLLLIATLAILKHMLSSRCFLQIAFYPWNQIPICFTNKSRLVCSSPSANPPSPPLPALNFHVN